jgi:hypothetical protein
MTTHNPDTCQHRDCNGGQKYYDDPHYPQCDPMFGATCGDLDHQERGGATVEVPADEPARLARERSEYEAQLATLTAENERLRQFQADIFEVYGGNYEPKGRLKDLSAVIERALDQHAQTAKAR